MLLSTIDPELGAIIGLFVLYIVSVIVTRIRNKRGISDSLKKVVVEILEKLPDDYNAVEKSNVKKWHDIMLQEIDSGKIKTFEQLKSSFQSQTFNSADFNYIKSESVA
jgi:hypothetical protein